MTVIFIHIPRTAGATLYSILDRQYACRREIYGETIVAEHFAEQPETWRMNIQLLRGHIPFGLHPYLAQPCQYITFLRDPVDRIISHYYYTQAYPAHYHLQPMSLHDYVTKAIESNAELREELSDGQTFQIAGSGPGDMLERAKENVRRHFAVVGLTERFDESISLMQERLGWSDDVGYVRRNVIHHPRASEFPARTLARIREINQADLELYEFARRRFGG